MGRFGEKPFENAQFDEFRRARVKLDIKHIGLIPGERVIVIKEYDAQPTGERRIILCLDDGEMRYASVNEIEYEG